MGGDDSKANLVRLTPREHFFAHQLLVKLYPEDIKLVYAVNMMKSQVSTSREYGWIRRLYGEARKGVQRTPESIAKQRATILSKLELGDWHFGIKGVPRTDDQKQAVSAALKGKTRQIKSGPSLAGYILRYGEEEGTIRYAASINKRKQRRWSLEDWISKYGEKEGTAHYRKGERRRMKAQKR